MKRMDTNDSLGVIDMVCTTSSTIQKEEVTEYFIEPVIPARRPFYVATKRVFDFVVALGGLGVMLVPMLLISVAIKLDSRGPVLFRQERLGKDGVPFIMFKFRSMYTDAEKNGPQWAEKCDWRCTRVGRFIRKTRLDELPQLFNILRGDMSLVGPRPERAYFYDQFEEYIHGFRNRLAVTPGLTGYAQVNGGYDLKPEEKIVYDMEYIARCSLRMDVE